jgi:hypothetical protein
MEFSTGMIALLALPEITSSIASATWLTAIFLAVLDSFTWARASSVKVPTGPRKAKVKLELGFDVLAGIKTRLELLASCLPTLGAL